MQVAIAPAERRQLRRNTVLRKAQVLFSSTLHDCYIVDSSEGGARIQTECPIALPANVVLRLADGQAIAATRAWSRGTEAGLAFAPEERGSGPDTAARLLAVGEVLAEGRIDAAVRDIRAARFFDDHSVKDATETAEAARLRLAAALRKAALDAA
jgi:hypothetical protein